MERVEVQSGEWRRTSSDGYKKVFLIAGYRRTIGGGMMKIPLKRIVAEVYPKDRFHHGTRWGWRVATPVHTLMRKNKIGESNTKNSAKASASKAANEEVRRLLRGMVDDKKFSLSVLRGFNPLNLSK